MNSPASCLACIDAFERQAQNWDILVRSEGEFLFFVRYPVIYPRGYPMTDLHEGYPMRVEQCRRQEDLLVPHERMAVLV